MYFHFSLGDKKTFKYSREKVGATRGCLFLCCCCSFVCSFVRFSLSLFFFFFFFSFHFDFDFILIFFFFFISHSPFCFFWGGLFGFFFCEKKFPCSFRSSNLFLDFFFVLSFVFFFL